MKADNRPGAESSQNYKRASRQMSNVDEMGAIMPLHYARM